MSLLSAVLKICFVFAQISQKCIVVAGSFASETTPTTGLARKSPTMDQGVQTSGGLANNAAGGNAGMPRGQRGGYQRGGGHDGCVRGGYDGYQRISGDGYMRGGYDGVGYQRGTDRRRYQPQYNSYGRYQQNDMRGGRPPMRG